MHGREEVVSEETYRKQPVDERREGHPDRNTSWSSRLKILVGLDGVALRYCAGIYQYPTEPVIVR